MSRVTLNSVYQRAAAIPGLFEPGEATGTARQLEQWQQALEAARKASKKDDGEEQGAWDLIFDNRADLHKEAMALSREAQEARLELELKLELKVSATAALAAYGAGEITGA